MISVCLASFNGAEYILDQVESILRSDMVGELLVSDDGSTDNTLQVLAAINDPRLTVLAGPQKGLIKNFEFVLQQASGDYIFLSDQDDIWLDNKVEVTLQALLRADLVVSDCQVVDAEGQVVCDSFYALRGSGPGLVKNLTKNSFLGCCMAFRRNVILAALPFPHGLPMHDWWLGMLATMVGRVEFVEIPLMLYRRHGGNASDTADKSSASRVKQLVWRVSLLMSLIKRYFTLKFN